MHHGYKDDIFEVIFNLHVQSPNLAKKITNLVKDEEKTTTKQQQQKTMNSAEFMELVFSMSGPNPLF